jgi:hypothetical protein
MLRGLPLLFQRSKMDKVESYERNGIDRAIAALEKADLSQQVSGSELTAETPGFLPLLHQVEP